MAVTMEDCNMLVADCIVICCCSQCLMLQIIVFVFVKLPGKLVRKTKAYAKKKLGARRGGRNQEREIMKKIVTRVKGGSFQDDEVDQSLELHTSSMRVIGSIEFLEAASGGGRGGDGGGQYQCCIEEVEKVLEQLSQKGEFSFGSFWGSSSSDSEERSPGLIAFSSSSCPVVHQFKDLVLCTTTTTNPGN